MASDKTSVNLECAARESTSLVKIWPFLKSLILPNSNINGPILKVYTNTLQIPELVDFLKILSYIYVIILLPD